MKWGNYIKRTAVRRVVWIIVGLLVYALFGLFTEASAQDVCGFPRIHDAATAAGGGQTYASQGEAYQACMSVAQEVFVTSGSGVSRFGEFQECRLNANGTAYVAWFMDSHQRYSSCAVHPNPPSNPQERRSNPTWIFTSNCAARSRIEFNTNVSLHGPPPIYMCDRGCEFIKTVDSPGQFCGLVEEGPNVGYWCNSEYTANGSTCTGGGDGTGPGDGSEPPPTDPDAPPKACGVGEVRLPSGNCASRGQCPLGQYEEDGVCRPAGSCPAGQVKGPDGSCIPTSCPAGQAMGQDGTCKADTNDDGTPDEDEPGGDGTNTDGMEFSGGESCEVPPSCSGDAIMCGQARIQWRIDCNTRKNSTVSGGNSCAPGSAPVCTGSMCDAVDQVKMLQLWEANCALQRLSEGSGEGTGGGGDLSGVEDRLDRIGNFLDGDGDCMATDGGCGDGDGDHWIDGDDVEASEWSSGLASSGSCPAPISTTVSLGGYVQDIEFSYQPLCDFAALMRWVLITAATILSALMIGGFRSNA